MGQLIIQTTGSFPNPTTETFSALEHGHAHAVAQAIEHLASVELPLAIALDHELAAEGHAPTSGGFKR